MFLVVGANGMLGRRVTLALLARGAKMRATSRRPETLAWASASGAEVSALDLARPGSFATPLAGVEAVFTAAHGLMDRSGEGSQRIDQEGMCRLIDAARGTGVRRFVYTSAQDAGPDSPAAFTRAKHAAEQHLRASSLDWTILRPSAFADLYAHAMIGEKVLAGKTVWLIGAGTTRRNMVAVDDVVTVALRALLDDHFSRECIDVVGPDNLTEREVAAVYGRLSGRDPKVRSVPVALARLVGQALRPVHAGPHSLISFLTAQEGRTDLMADAAGMTERLGRPPTQLEALARQHLDSRASR